MTPPGIPEFPDEARLRERGTRKWTSFDADVAPLWVAESDAATCPAVLDAIREAVDREFLGYPPADELGLGAATAGWYARTTGWDPDPARVHAVADVVRGVTLAVAHLTRAGSPIVLPTPAYMPFFEVGPATGRETITIPTGERGPDPAAVARAFAAGAGALILCNPNNPLGFTHEPALLAELAGIAERHGARIIADEIHAPVVLEGAHTPAASVSAAAERVTVTVTATSKGWNTAGLKCAQVILGDTAADAAAWASIPHILTSGASTLGMAAAVAAWTAGEEWRAGLLAALRANRALLARRLPEVAPGIRWRPPAATYLAWLDLRGVAGVDHADPAGWLLEHARVAVNPGTAFGAGGRGRVRLNFAANPTLLAGALDRIGAAVAAA